MYVYARFQKGCSDWDVLKISVSKTRKMPRIMASLVMRGFCIVKTGGLPVFVRWA